MVSFGTVEPVKGYASACAHVHDNDAHDMLDEFKIEKTTSVAP
jgi:hypothetical protein